VIREATAALLALIGVATVADAQTKTAVPPSPSAPTVYVAPTPTPQPPPTNPGPAVVPPAGLSPLLSQPGLLFSPGRPVGPSYPASPVPAPVDQQKMQSYRSDLVNQRFQLDRQGVSPGDQRYREIQQQLNQPGLR
jgi:hypothetical protein